MDEILALLEDASPEKIMQLLETVFTMGFNEGVARSRDVIIEIVEENNRRVDPHHEVPLDNPNEV